MAVCLTCHQPMQQTEAVCAACGANYFDREMRWTDLFVHQTSILDWLRLITAIGLPLALFRCVNPIETTAWFGLGLAANCYLATRVLGQTSPLWTRIFSAIGLLALLVAYLACLLRLN